MTREAELLVRDVSELDQKITRTEEWMCCECIQTGKVPIRDYDSQRLIAELDYGPIVNTVLEKPWTDPTSNPLNDLRACIRGVASNANLVADLIVFGSNAASLFESHVTVQDAYNNLFIKQGEITPQMIAWNVTSLGTYRGIPLYIYESTYTDNNGNSLFYLDPDTVLVACSQNKGRMAYAGCPQQNDDETNLTIVAGKRVPLVWFPEHSDMRKLRLASRPCPVPPDSSNWTVMNVV